MKFIRITTGKMTVRRSSGNVFADLGFDNPEEEKLKARWSAKFATSLSIVA